MIHITLYQEDNLTDEELYDALLWAEYSSEHRPVRKSFTSKYPLSCMPRRIHIILQKSMTLPGFLRVIAL